MVSNHFNNNKGVKMKRVLIRRHLKTGAVLDEDADKWQKFLKQKEQKKQPNIIIFTDKEVTIITSE
jgi:hypothetical protein